MNDPPCTLSRCPEPRPSHQRRALTRQRRKHLRFTREARKPLGVTRERSWRAENLVRTEACSGSECHRYFVGTSRFSSSNQFTTTIILETTFSSYGCTMMNALPSGVTSYPGLSIVAGA